MNRKNRKRDWNWYDQSMLRLIEGMGLVPKQPTPWWEWVLLATGVAIAVVGLWFVL